MSPMLPPQRLLIIRNDNIGDMVLTLPMFEAARTAWPDARLTLLTRDYVAPLAECSPHLNELLVDQPSDSVWQLARRLRTGRYDTAIIINASKRICLAVWLAGIPRRLMSSRKVIARLTCNMQVKRDKQAAYLQHEAETTLDFLRCLGAEPKLADCTRSLAIDAVTRERVKQRLRRELGTQGPLLGVHPGNLGHAYNWSIGRYAELVKRLMQHGRVLVTGSPKEIGLHDAIRKQIGEHPGRVAYVHDLSLLELIAAIEQLDVLTVSSTGPLHLAGVMGTPVVGLFSTHLEQSPLKWAPYGPGNVILQAPLLPGEDSNFPPERGTEQMERISVDEVEAAVLSRVNRRRAV